jgi:hypothetical protein
MWVDNSMVGLRWLAWGVGAAWLLATVSPLPAIAQFRTQVQPVKGPGIGRTEALAGALVGTPAGMNALNTFLDGANGVPEKVTERAVQLINELRRGDITGDPVALQQAADRIAEAAGRSLKSAQIVKLQVDKDFTLGAGRTGFDFGPPDQPPMPGFKAVTARDSQLSGDLQNLRRPTGDPLQASGIRGIRQIKVPYPDGPVRIMLLTDAYNDAAVDDQPFGAEVVANGTSVRVSRTAPSDWLPNAYLTNAGPYMDDAYNGNRQLQGIGNQSGGVLIVNAVVTNGVLNIDLKPVPGKSTYLTGMIVEPVRGESVLYGTGEARDVLRIAANGRGAGAAGDRLAETLKRAEAQIQSAVANLLSTIATAAGPGALAELANLPAPTADSGERVSEN